MYKKITYNEIKKKKQRKLSKGKIEAKNKDEAIGGGCKKQQMLLNSKHFLKTSHRFHSELAGNQCRKRNIIYKVHEYNMVNNAQINTFTLNTINFTVLFILTSINIKKCF